MITLINQTCQFCGDKTMTSDILHDFVDSVYTSCGKIDGEIYYPDFVEYMTIHPIVELYISPQYQGNAGSKLLTEEEIERKF
jgi:hypothetical protein